MTSRDTIFVFEDQHPFDSDSSAAPSTSDSVEHTDSIDKENRDPLATIEALKKKLEETEVDLDDALSATREWRERAKQNEKEAERLQARLEQYDDVLTSMRTGHVAAVDGVKVEVEDWETMINKTLVRNQEDPVAHSPSTADDNNLDFLKKLTQDMDQLTIQINRMWMREKEDQLRIKALENVLELTRHKVASEKNTLFGTVEMLQDKLTTAQSSSVSLRSVKDKSEDVTKELNRLRAITECDSKKIEDLLMAQVEKDSHIAQLIEEVNFIHSRDKVTEDLVHKQAKTIGELNVEIDNLRSKLEVQEEGFAEEQRKVNTRYSRLHDEHRYLQRTYDNMTKEYEKELETQKKLIEKLSRQSVGLEKQVTDMEKADEKNQKLMNGLREQNEDLMVKLGSRKDEIKALKGKLQSQTATCSDPKLRLVSDSSLNSPRIQMRPAEKSIKMEEDVECLPDSESDDVIVTKRVIPKRVRLLSSPVKSASKKLRM